MTVIAWDGATLAADGRITSGTSIATDNFNKLHTFKVPIAYINGDKLLHIGVSGTIRYKDQVVAMFERNVDKFEELSLANSSIDHGIEALIIGNKYVYSLERNSMLLVRYPKSTKLTEGSGSQFATSAMVLGLDAVEAVKHACKLDGSCGGRIRSIQCG